MPREIELDPKTESFLKANGHTIGEPPKTNAIAQIALLSIPLLAGLVAICGNRTAEYIGLAIATLYMLSALWFNFSSTIAKKDTPSLAVSYFLTQRYNSSVPFKLTVVNSLFLIGIFFMILSHLSGNSLLYIPTWIVCLTLWIATFNDIKRFKAAEKVKAQAAAE